jgi:hypothetical protein
MWLMVLFFGGPYAKSKINIGEELAADHGPPKKKEKECLQADNNTTCRPKQKRNVVALLH